MDGRRSLPRVKARLGPRAITHWERASLQRSGVLRGTERVRARHPATTSRGESARSARVEERDGVEVDGRVRVPVLDLEIVTEARRERDRVEDERARHRRLADEARRAFAGV